MKQIILAGCIALIAGITMAQNSKFSIRNKDGLYLPEISIGEKVIISAPEDGLWSIATSWKNSWPENWHHTSPVRFEQSGEWQIISGEMTLPQGNWKIRDAYRHEKGIIKCVRRFEWTGTQQLDSITLSVRFNVQGNNLQAFLPGILYYGNPSGYRKTPGCVPHYFGEPGEKAVFEEHRYPIPFACLESAGEDKFGAVMHTIASAIYDHKLPDHWWSMGIIACSKYSEIVLLTGPVTCNGQPGSLKANQCNLMKYDNTFFSVKPGTIIEKTFYLDAFSIERRGTAFQKPLYDAINLYKPFYTENLPSYHDIIESKYRQAKSRWIEGDGYAGFNMYPPSKKPEIVMGWCGQACSPGYSLQILKEQLNNDANIDYMVQKSLDFLSSWPVNADGFPVRYGIENKEFRKKDPVSMGQAMYNMAKAIEVARKNKQYNTSKWEQFIKTACNAVTQRILDDSWSPRSTAEGFYIAPLSLASALFGNDNYKAAAIKAANYYANRHLDMKEPYWGGTLDASGEDKEGAWAAFQGFLHVYNLTKEKKYLQWAQHACDVCLSYVVVWDIPLPPGRLTDHQFKTRGWTVVSPQNQHIDAYGVIFSPEVYQMGVLTCNENLKRLAKVMFLSCGQLIDPYGSQGEQLQQTNFAQSGNLLNTYRLRGGYAEQWTVFWITAHFLNAAAKFREMGVAFE